MESLIDSFPTPLGNYRYDNKLHALPFASYPLQTITASVARFFKNHQERTLCHCILKRNRIFFNIRSQLQHMLNMLSLHSRNEIKFFILRLLQS